MRNTPSVPRLLLRFLGSMNLAVTLLVAIAIAAIIGTVLQQNQPYPDYVLKFGPFWFEVFKALDLFDVYSSLWFLAILGFLVLSTGICLYRNTPRMLKDLRDYREQLAVHSLRKQDQVAEWRVALDAARCAEACAALLRHKGYRVKARAILEGQAIAAKTGGGSRWGYLSTHAAIVIICVGGLVDGNLPLKLAHWRGTIQEETRNIPADEVPASSTLPVDNLAFRANVSIAEGQRADVAFVDFKDGYLVQKLPFGIQLDEFRIEHYPSGQPKSFESDLTILDKSAPQPLKQTIAVNHPLSYKGYTIYQASFSDGGSRLRLKLWPLRGDQPSAQEIDATVNQAQKIASTSGGDLTLEIGDFRPFNVQPDPRGVKKFKDIGPNFQFKLRNASGEALEYVNYMRPVEQQGGWFFLSGMRRSPAEDFSYWFVPADSKNRIDRYMRFAALLRDEKQAAALAQQVANGSGSGKRLPDDQRQMVATFMQSIAQQFVEGGLEAISEKIDQSVPETKREEVAGLYSNLLQHFLRAAYRQVLASEGVKDDAPLNEFDTLFYENAVTALGLTAQYGAPLYVELLDYDQRRASGVQITRAPGRWLVFPGCVLLAVGVFLMFYLPQRRIWVVLDQQQPGVTAVLLAGHAQRNRFDFEEEFGGIRAELQHLLNKI